MKTNTFYELKYIRTFVAGQVTHLDENALQPSHHAFELSLETKLGSHAISGEDNLYFYVWLFLKCGQYGLYRL